MAHYTCWLAAQESATARTAKVVAIAAPAATAKDPQSGPAHAWQSRRALIAAMRDRSPLTGHALMEFLIVFKHLDGRGASSAVQRIPEVQASCPPRKPCQGPTASPSKLVERCLDGTHLCG